MTDDTSEFTLLALIVPVTGTKNTWLIHQSMR